MGKPATIDAGQEQHLQALEYANRVRLARARMKRRIAAGELSAAEVILSCPWQAHSMSISDLLMSQKRWGRAVQKAARVAGRPGEQAGRDAHRAPATGAGRRAHREERPGSLHGRRPLRDAPPAPRGALALARRADGRLTGAREGRPGERPAALRRSASTGRSVCSLAILDYVPVGIAQVDRPEVGPVHHVGRRDPLRAQVVAPGGELRVGLHRQGEVMVEPRPTVPSSRSGVFEAGDQRGGRSRPRRWCRAFVSSSFTVCFTSRIPSTFL